MKKAVLLICILLVSVTSKTQNRNVIVKELNNFIQYSNANITALSITLTSLERYNGLFNDYLRNDTKLGGEAYEKPKPSPFLDSDIFTINEDNPDYLYSKALKESVHLPADIKTELYKTTKLLRQCSENIIVLIDSMSNLFSGPLISVTKNPDVLPYSLLFEVKRQLQLSKNYRDQLLFIINKYYAEACPLNASEGDYIYSINPLKKGVELCQGMINDLYENDSSNILQYVQSLDSLTEYLEQSELTLLKGVKSFGKSKHFPNAEFVDGFDLYLKYENIVEQLQIFSNIGKRFLNESNTIHASGKCYYFHKECSLKFNSVVGLLYYYNEYVLLIGGGKMKLRSEAGSKGYIYKGWGDGSHSLPVRTMLLGMKETPRFEIGY